MSNIVIKVENISKQYRLGEVGTGSMRDDFKRFRYRMMGKEDPFLTIGEENNRITKSQSDYVWALRNINFEVKQGDVVGIIGRNGAGKSTLLKILSRTTGPTTGSVKMKGRIASLLEVGTGFHGELSGRENIFLNGAIMGLRKHEISAKLDEIIDFAGVERYIDTPVKRYSSGMYVRLAFAVAAYLEPDILIVDEVLAVGDMEFQKKALGKMKDVSLKDGRTVLFVSHNLAAISSLCNSAMLLNNGQLNMYDSTHMIINEYLSNSKKPSNYFYESSNLYVGDRFVKLLVLKIINENKENPDLFYVNEKIGVQIEYEILKKGQKPEATFAVISNEDVIILHCVGNFENYEVGFHKAIFWFPPNFLNDSEYKLLVGITSNNPVIIHGQHEIYFRVMDALSAPTRGNYMGKMHGLIRPFLNSEKYYDEYSHS